MSVRTCVSVWFSQNSSPPEQRKTVLLLLWVHVYTTSLINRVDTCVLALKPGGNCAKIYTSGRTKSKEASWNTIKKAEKKDLVSVMKEIVWQPLFSHQTRNQVPKLQNGNTPTRTVGLAEERICSAYSLGDISGPNRKLLWNSQSNPDNDLLIWWLFLD